MPHKEKEKKSGWTSLNQGIRENREHQLPMSGAERWEKKNT